MGFSLYYFSHICVILLYILTLHCAAAKFDYNQMIHDEIEDERSKIVGGLTPISHKDLKNYPDLQEGLKIAEDLNQDLVFDRKSLAVSVQVVQGDLYHVNVNVSQSCSASKNCSVKKHCSFTVWSRVWLLDDERLIVSPLDCTHS